MEFVELRLIYFLNIFYHKQIVVNIKKENALRQKKILKITTHKMSFTPIKENIASDWENIFRRKPFLFYFIETSPFYATQ